METFIHIDSIYLNVKYPRSDVYQYWAKFIEGVDHRELKQGINAEGFVIRTGASGYKFSVWRGDIRAFLTPETDELRGKDNGMGIWLQLGPKFIIANGWDIQAGVLEFLYELGVEGPHPITMTRIDLAVDVFNLHIESITIEEIRNNWVGRSTLGNIRLDKKTKKITGYEIGSRKSAVYFRIYDKKLQAIETNEIEYWYDVWGRPASYVTRFEWQIAPKKGNFPNSLIDFYKFNEDVAKQLGLYILDWGRLAVPNPNDKVRSRWDDTELWKGLREAINQWNPKDLEKLTRCKPYSTEISAKYARQLAGIYSGAMAKYNPENPNFHDMIEGIHSVVPLDELTQKARDKGEKIQILRQKPIEGEEIPEW